MRSIRFVLLSFAALVLGACGGGSTATVHLYDAPPPGVTSVKITFSSVQVHVVDAAQAKDADPNDKTIDNDDKWQTLAIGRTIDLVPLQGETAATKLGDLALPAGKITQVRLVIDKAKDNTATKDGKVCNLDVSKVETTGMKIIHPFKAIESKSGGKLELWLDFRLDEALKASGDCFEVQPTLKLTKAVADGAAVTL